MMDPRINEEGPTKRVLSLKDNSDEEGHDGGVSLYIYIVSLILSAYRGRPSASPRKPALSCRGGHFTILVKRRPKVCIVFLEMFSFIFHSGPLPESSGRVHGVIVEFGGQLSGALFVPMARLC